ncbi:hypothetical protein LZP69_02080 [Shewanella sp. AS1]|uniref:hypothetical protein n=1 Tax=Shewanella sp. AS1 TaxID=2907626 RepID=UPI001F3D15DB|nr:hypothetical protein [Shewanella sp. AS1]MCE9677982.1 hypothetical protein [Shewanella sp. AS1]
MTSITPQSMVINDHSLGHLLYGMMLAFPLFLLPPILGLVINFAQKHNRMDELLYSHIRWQRWSLLSLFSLLILAYSLPHIGFSLVLSLLTLAWFCHRTIKGWMALADGHYI